MVSWISSRQQTGVVDPAGGGNGVVDVLDALQELKIAVGLVTPDPQEQIAGDVHPDNTPDPDGDGDIDALDALRILKTTVGRVTIAAFLRRNYGN